MPHCAMEAFALGDCGRHGRHRRGLARFGRHQHRTRRPRLDKLTPARVPQQTSRAPLREIEALIETAEPARRGRDCGSRRSSPPGHRQLRRKCLTPDPGHRAAEIASVPATATPDRRPGYLVINPSEYPAAGGCDLARRCGADLRPEGLLRAAQFTEHGIYAVVDLPPSASRGSPGRLTLGRPPRGPRPVDGEGATASQRVDGDRDRRGHRRHSRALPRWASRWPGWGSSSLDASLLDQPRQTGGVSDAARRGSTSITAAPPSCKRPPPA